MMITVLCNRICIFYGFRSLSKSTNIVLVLNLAWLNCMCLDLTNIIIKYKCGKTVYIEMHRGEFLVKLGFPGSTQCEVTIRVSIWVMNRATLLEMLTLGPYMYALMSRFLCQILRAIKMD